MKNLVKSLIECFIFISWRKLWEQLQLNSTEDYASNVKITSHNKGNACAHILILFILYLLNVWYIILVSLIHILLFLILNEKKKNFIIRRYWYMNRMCITTFFRVNKLKKFKKKKRFTSINLKIYQFLYIM